ncbi:MAG TPA: SH3 domain-containing protein [Xanthobacteraceae bacterium]|jgi:hypothetical protein|nr:SH3 domain-containing protein [Xanthobacteraceae bacterium]
MNFARLAAGSAIFVMLLADVAAAKPVTVTADVNLRKGPGTANDIITLIPKGSMVDVGTCTYGWCQVSYNGQDGYSIAANLGLGGPVRRPPPANGYPPPPDDDYPPPPPPGYVVGPPVYYAPPVYYGPCCGPYYGWGWRGGWRRHW